MLLNAATLITWVRHELGAEVYLEPARHEPPAWSFIRLRAPSLKKRVARAHLLGALDRNGTAVLQILLAEQRERGPAPAGAEVVQWTAP
jgi:hypothetical protein